MTKKSKFHKSKMADRRHLENRFSAIYLRLQIYNHAIVIVSEAFLDRPCQPPVVGQVEWRDAVHTPVAQYAESEMNPLRNLHGVVMRCAVPRRDHRTWRWRSRRDITGGKLSGNSRKN